MRQILTKLAIVLGFVTYCKLGWWSPGAATTLCLVCLGLSVLADTARSKRRGQRSPIDFGFGWLALGTALVVVPLMGLANHAIGYVMMDFWASLGTAFFVATVLRASFLFSEGLGTMLWKLIEGLFKGKGGGGRPAYRNPNAPKPEPQYTDFVPPSHWRFQCPECGARVEHAIDVCWNCDYGSDEPAKTVPPVAKPPGLKYQDPVPPTPKPLPRSRRATAPSPSPCPRRHHRLRRAVLSSPWSRGTDTMFYRLSKYQTPATAYPRGRRGRAVLGDHFWQKGSFYDNYGSAPPGDTEDYSAIKVERRTKITTLEIDGQTWMVDDPPHWWTIQRHAADYEGHVLVAGLGLGLIVHALSQNPKVTGITVVELEQDVIDLVGPHVPSCNIVRADWYEYEANFKVGGVFFDLFVGDGRQLTPLAIGEMVSLRRRFPGVLHRILGFHNDALIRHAVQIEQAQKIAEEMLRKGTEP